MTVFANKLEVSCKAQANKVVAAFPDVCMTPPEAPPTPPGIPIPYPNFGMDSDTDKGTGSVKIGGKTINLKNTSYFTKTTGDEAGAAAKKGVVSSKNTGKAYSQAFSMNVKAEGKNLTRFSDIQTDNHGSPPNAPPFPKIGSPNPPKQGDVCFDDYDKAEKACDGKDIDQLCKDAGMGDRKKKRQRSNDGDGFNTTETVFGVEIKENRLLLDASDKVQKDDCLSALTCQLLPYKPDKCPCKGQTGHHLIPASAFFTGGRKPKASKDHRALKIHEPPETPGPDYKKPGGYKERKAPCVCAEGSSNTCGSHGMMHSETSGWVDDGADIDSAGSAMVDVGGTMETRDMPTSKYGETRDEAIAAVGRVFPLSGCDPDCLAAQMDAYHVDELGMAEDTKIRAERCGRSEEDAQAHKLYVKLRQSWLENG